MGRQFADDSMTPDPISVSRNQYMDEIPSDRPMHGDCTPGHSNPAYTGRQYAGNPMGGTPVGGGSKATSTDVNVHEATRGKEQ